MTKVTETALVEDVKVREQYMDRVDVLDKVKKLLLLPGMDMATSRQVADFYEVPFKTINAIVNRNKVELETDGMGLMRRKDMMLKLQDAVIEITPQLAIITDDRGTAHKFTNRGNMVFPRRAILRVGMLLRDSEIAKEVRTQLLNQLL